VVELVQVATLVAVLMVMVHQVVQAAAAGVVLLVLP
jgi:hypothetical protein